MDFQRNGQQLSIMGEDNWVADNIQKLRDQLSANVNEEHALEQVTLDLTRVAFMDSLGLKLVLGLFKSCQDHNTIFEVTTTKDSQVSKVLNICGLNKLIRVEETEAHVHH